MDIVKIQNFDGGTFPQFNTLSDAETQEIREDLRKAFRVSEGSSNLDFLKALDSMATNIDQYQADTENFDLRVTLDDLGISPMEQVLVNWYRYDQIDEMSFQDLAKYFHDIWYPGPDDIDILDRTFSWVLSIRHSGTVKLLLKASSDPV